MSGTRDYRRVVAPAAGDESARATSLIDLLWSAFSDEGYSWVGVYSKTPGRDEMELGPRRDKPACSPIGLHGMCGFCWRERRGVLVDDVRRLGESYVACDPRDMSELVVPLLRPDGRCWGVLDVDSFEVGAFSAHDALEIARLAHEAGLTTPLGDRAWPILAGDAC